MPFVARLPERPRVSFMSKWRGPDRGPQGKGKDPIIVQVMGNAQARSWGLQWWPWATRIKYWDVGVNACVLSQQLLQPSVWTQGEDPQSRRLHLKSACMPVLRLCVDLAKMTENQSSLCCWIQLWKQPLWVLKWLVMTCSLAGYGRPTVRHPGCNKTSWLGLSLTTPPALAGSMKISILC